MAGDHDLRLQKMESWYDDLLSGHGCADHLLHDYEPHREFLRSLRGSIVDIGGGAGIAARFMHPGVSYTVVEPQDFWRSSRWDSRPAPIFSA